MFSTMPARAIERVGTGSADRGLALVDVLAPDVAGAAKALDVFVRRLVPASVTSDTRMRG